jgi:hypothetical protein
MNTLKNWLAYFGALRSLLLIVGIIYAVALWAKGVLPALLRLGNGLAKRKIALFAKGDNVSSLRNLLTDSKLFKPKNICEISKKEDIGRAESATMFLVYWPDWAADIAEILDNKRDECALIVYAPYDKGRIPDDQMKNLDGKRHTAVTNFRGRLLNDIVASMITTSYEKV